MDRFDLHLYDSVWSF